MKAISAIAFALLGTTLTSLSAHAFPFQAGSSVLQPLSALPISTQPISTQPTSAQPISTQPFSTPSSVFRPIPTQLIADSRSTSALAKHLKRVGARMFGAYWCPHCTHQKDLFGSSAFSDINYIECDPKGENARPKLCRDAKISGYPTWEIKGKFYPGVQTLEDLAKWSGYQGPNKF